MTTSDLDVYKATVGRRSPSRILYYGNFISSLAERICRDLHLDPKADLQEHFGLFGHVEIRPLPPTGYSPLDFSA